jgi:hypothetical protein
MMNDDVVLGKWYSRTAAGSFLGSIQCRAVGLMPSAQAEAENGSGSQ